MFLILILFAVFSKQRSKKIFRSKNNSKDRKKNESVEVDNHISALWKAINVAGENLLSPLSQPIDNVHYELCDVKRSDDDEKKASIVVRSVENDKYFEFLNVPIGHHDTVANTTQHEKFVTTASAQQALSEMSIDHACNRDMLLIGPSGTVFMY